MSSYWRTSKRLQWRSSFYSKVVRPLSYYDLWEYVLKHPPSSKSTDGWVSNFAINECLLGMEITSFRKNKTLVIGRTSFTSKVLFIRITSFNIRRERVASHQYLWSHWIAVVVYFFWLVSTISICVTSRVFIYSVSLAPPERHMWAPLLCRQA